MAEQSSSGKEMLRIDLLHPEVVKATWEGVVDGYVSEGASAEESKSAIHAAVEALLRSFPLPM